MSRRVSTAVLAALLVLAACGEARDPATSLEDSRALLQAEIDGVARQAVGDLRWRAEPPVPPELCDTAGGAVAEAASSASYGLEARLPTRAAARDAIAAVAAEWRRRGYREVEVDAGGQAASAERDGLLVELTFDRRGRRAFLGGSTPCLRPPGR